VFNLGSYLALVGGPGEGASTRAAVDEIGKLIRDTVDAIAQARGGNFGDGRVGSPNKTPEPFIKFHAGTGLLVVVGGPDALEAARKVVSALPRDHSPAVNGQKLEAPAGAKPKLGQ